MDALVLNSIRNLEDKNEESLEKLLSSEAFYWLSMAVALSFARDALCESGKNKTEAVVARFTMTLRSAGEEISSPAISLAQKDALLALNDIHGFLNDCVIFNRKKALPVCLSFTKYWLFNKLIELEWQQKLSTEAIVDTYLFLDGVIADQEELAYISEKIEKADTLLDDEVIYLRTHFANARKFFLGLENELKLISLKQAKK